MVIFPDASDAGSDVIMVMSGASGYGEVFSDVQAGSIGAADLRLANTIGYRANDLLMIGSNGECLIIVSAARHLVPGCQIGAATATTLCGPLLPLAGAYFTSTGTHTSARGAQRVGSGIHVHPRQSDQRQPARVHAAGRRCQFDAVPPRPAADQRRSTCLRAGVRGVRVLRAVRGIDTNADGIPMHGSRPAPSAGTARR